MSSKFLNTFTDENPNVQKQIGCMTGIFQMFDRHHLLTGRRLNGHNHKTLPSGNILPNNSTLQAERNVHSSPWMMVPEKNSSTNKSLNEKRQEVSVESSSRASFSSSSCSSFSSLECNKSTTRGHQEASSHEHSTFYPASRSSSKTNPPKLQPCSDVINTMRPLRSSPPCRDTQQSTSTRQPPPLDFRGVIKDSIHRDSTSTTNTPHHGLSVKTSSKEEVVKKNVMKHKDSPRPLPPSKSMMDGQYNMTRINNGKPKASMETNKSLRVLTKLREEAPISSFLNSEDKEERRPPRRMSYEGEDILPCFVINTVPKEAPRHSYDGDYHHSREEYHSGKCSAKLRELPRLSLDSRQGSLMRRGCSNFDDANRRGSRALSLQQELESCKGYSNCSSVVAKLMGLEAMPNLSSSGAGRDDDSSVSATSNTTFEEDRGKRNTFLSIRSGGLKMPPEGESKQDQLLLSCSPKSSPLKGGSIKNIPRSKTTPPDPVVKHNSKHHPRLPIETAPWREQKQQQGKEQGIPSGGGIQKAAQQQQQHVVSPSVYSEIEKKLKDIDIQQSNYKDLRALKRILDAIQAKGLLLEETKRGEDNRPSLEASSVAVYAGKKCTTPPPTTGRRPDQDLRRLAANRQNTWRAPGDTETTPRPLDSPIVIMKPAKFLNKSAGVPPASPTTISPFDSLSGLQKVRTSCRATDITRKVASDNQFPVKEQTPPHKHSSTSNSSSNTDSPAANQILSSAGNNSNSNRQAERSATIQKHLVQRLQSSSRPQETTTENSGSLVMKSSGSLSPRLQQKRYELEKKSRAHVPSSHDSSKPRKQATTKKPSTDLSSPRCKLRKKPTQVWKNDDQLSEISGATSFRSDSNISSTSRVDVEVPSALVDVELTSADQSSELDSIFIQQGSPRQPDRTLDNTTSILKQKKSLQSFNEDASSAENVVALEQPSPVSVLDASFYKDDLLPSPVNEVSSSFQDVGENSNTLGPKHKELENVESLLKKLRQLSTSQGGGSSGGEAVAEVDTTAAAAVATKAAEHVMGCLCCCESQVNPNHRYISEILLASGLLHLSLGAAASGSHPPINPELFLVLEQQQEVEEEDKDKLVAATQRSKGIVEPKRLHRKVLFDTVNEFLLSKLDSSSGLATRRRRAWLSTRIPSGQKLLTDLCLEIDRLQAYRGGCILDDGDDDDDGIKSILREDVERRTEGWADFSKDVCKLVLDIERSIFKDIIDEVVSGEGGESPAPGISSAKLTRRRQHLLAK